MRWVRFWVVLSFLAIGLTARADDEKASPTDNIPPEGFTALFNGKDLDNWQGCVDLRERETMAPGKLKEWYVVQDKLAKEVWTVKDGVIHHYPKVKIDAAGKERKTGCNLQTKKDYADFELWIDWKINKGTDSGIYLRGTPQVQIWDSDNLGKDPKLIPDKGTGSGGLWNNPLENGVDPKSIGKTPLKRADKPVGEWNTFKIVMKANKVTVRLNDELVVDNAALAPYWDKSKPLPDTGPIELQYHLPYQGNVNGDRFYFKNIYIKELK